MAWAAPEIVRAWLASTRQTVPDLLGELCLSRVRFRPAQQTYTVLLFRTHRPPGTWNRFSSDTQLHVKHPTAFWALLANPSIPHSRGAEGILPIDPVLIDPSPNLQDLKLHYSFLEDEQENSIGAIMLVSLRILSVRGFFHSRFSRGREDTIVFFSGLYFRRMDL